MRNNNIWEENFIPLYSKEDIKKFQSDEPCYYCGNNEVARFKINENILICEDCSANKRKESTKTDMIKLEHISLLIKSDIIVKYDRQKCNWKCYFDKCSSGIVGIGDSAQKAVNDYISRIKGKTLNFSYDNEEELTKFEMPKDIKEEL
jgi:hypothetical protein